MKKLLVLLEKIGFINISDPNAVVPWRFGFCYLDMFRARTISILIPFNVIVMLLRDAYFFMRYFQVPICSKTYSKDPYENTRCRYANKFCCDKYKPFSEDDFLNRE